MSVGFLRRSGSRVSIRRLARPCVHDAPSLYKHSMPPRITQKSDRPRVSDRTMVANFATVKLASFGNRIAPSRQLNGTTGMEDALAASHDESEPSVWTDHQSKPAAVRRAGRQDENPLGLRSRGGIFLLTSPFIGL